MGTTLTALTASATTGIAYDVVVAIEGYPKLLTTGSAAAAVTAWAATDWTEALSGLTISWNLSQRLHPYEPFSNDESTVTLTVQDVDGADTFGTAVFDRESGEFAKLVGDLPPATTDIATTGSSDFDATDNYVHVGPEAIHYDNFGSNEFTDCTRGYWSPAQTYNGGVGARFARYHRATATLNGPDPVSVPATSVRDKPLTWRGRWVYCYIHRKLAGVLDTKAEAHLAFAGKIADVTDAVDGRTVVTVESVQKVITDTVVMREQWHAKVHEGVELKTGTLINAISYRDPVGGAVDSEAANALEVVAAGAANVNEIDAGIYTGDEITEKVNAWLAAERVAGRLLFKMNLSYSDQTSAGDPRSSLSMSDTDTSVGFRSWSVSTTQGTLARLFGWDPAENKIAGTLQGTNYSGKAFSFEAPRRHMFGFTGGFFASIPIRAVQGSFVNQGSFLPPGYDLGGYVGVLRIGENYYPCKTPSVANGDGTVEITIPLLHQQLGVGITGNWQDLPPDADGVVRISQVLVLQGTFKKLVLSLLSSTGSTDFNWDDYDTLPDHVGAAIPYDLISPLETELAACPGADDVFPLIVDKPTRLADLLNADFVLRGGIQFIWKQGKLHLKGWATPTSAATLTLTNADKFRRTDEDDPLRIVTTESDEYLRNTVVIKHRGTPLGNSYRDTTTVTDVASAAAHGSRGMTITARNSIIGHSMTGADLEHLLPAFAASMSLLSRPMMRTHLRIGWGMFETHTPGEVVLLTDPFVRDYANGSRSITGKPALIIGSRFDWADGVGELDLAMWPGLFLAPWSPCARVDETVSGGGFSAGYNNGTTTLRCKTNYHSPSGAAADASRFAVGQKVKVLQIDPDDPTSFLSWDREIDAISGNDIQVDSALAGWDANFLYRIISQDYANAVTAQRADTYQADDADGLVADLRQPFALAHFGTGQTTSYTDSAATELPARPPNVSYGDGRPLDVGHAFDLATALNNGRSYKWASQVPEVTDEATYGVGPGGGSWRLVYCRPVFLGVGRPTAARTRKLYVSPSIMKMGAVSSAVRVTLARFRPRSADPANPSRDDVVRVAPYDETTFTTTSTSYENQTAVALDTDHLALGPGPLGGIGWLYVEIQQFAYFRGFGLCHVGPVVAP